MMRRVRKSICVLFVIYVGLGMLRAESLPPMLSPDAQMSILVASPSREAVYTYYGHAGFRVRDEQQGLDLTFNYGIFSFSDDFLFRFVAGKTDYMVIPQYSSDYLDEYLARGSRVSEICLDLKPWEQAKAWGYLLNNIRAENRAYRYQFFTDNCATRMVDIVDYAVGGLLFAETYESKAEDTATSIETWRQEINYLEASSALLVLGTDLALGSPTDEAMTLRGRAFSPRHLAEVLQAGRRSSDGTALVSCVRYLGAESAEVDAEQGYGASLYLLFAVLAFVLSLLALYIYRLIFARGDIALAWDLILFLPSGLAGLVLFYISLISEHQFVYPNYNLWVLHPLHLLPVVSCIFAPRSRYIVYYHFCNFVAVSAFMLGSYFLPQSFNPILYVVAGGLGTVSLLRWLTLRRSR